MRIVPRSPARTSHPGAGNCAGAARTAAWLLVVSAGLLGGCAAVPDTRTQQIAADTGTILRMDPDACWTESYNRLVEHGPDGIHYLMARPEMQRPAAPDDLRVLLLNSLVRRLAGPKAAPKLSANALETTLGLLHFDLKVDGGPLGPTALPMRRLPRSWLDLYPAAFNHALAARVDVEADRRALVAWYAAHRNSPAELVTRYPLRPDTAHLWRVLARRYADRWGYAPEPRAVLCAEPPRVDALLIHAPSYDYNLVRAACIWLGSRAEERILADLIELVGHPEGTVAHNARFALEFSPNPRVREVVRRFRASRAERPDDGGARAPSDAGRFPPTPARASF